MKATQWQMLQALATHFHKGPIEELSQYLPESEREPFTSSNPELPFEAQTQSAEDIFNSVHCSWLKAPMKEAPEPFQKLVLKSLSDEYSNDLAITVALPKEEEKLSPPVKHFILNLFRSRYAKNLKVIPPNENPGELASLSSWHHEKIKELSFLLGLWDLSEEIRRVIDKKRLKTIFKCLEPREQIFLKNCLQGRDKLALPSIVLERWKGECKELRALITKRGLSRIAKALSGHPLETIKIICRNLNTSLAKQLVAYIKHKSIRGVTPIAINQVKQAIKFLDQQKSN